MKERIKEMNEMFPEFPKIEDTLKEIENHLDNIVKLNDNNGKFSPPFFDFNVYATGQITGLKTLFKSLECLKKITKKFTHLVT